MSAMPSLESFCTWTREEVRAAVLRVAEDSGAAGFTAEDVRMRAWWGGFAPATLSATIASLVSRGRIDRVATERARFPSAKHRKLGRYVLKVQRTQE